MISERVFDSLFLPIWIIFIITEELKLFYYRGLREWGRVNEYLTDTCLSAQDSYKKLLDYFRIKY